MILWTAMLALLGCRPPTAAPEAPVPDLVVIGTVHATPPDAPREAAVLVEDGQVVAVIDPEEGRARAGAETQVLEAPRITPGFVDAHAHPLGLGQALSALDLVDLPTYAAVLAAVAEAADEGTGWLLGRGWDQNDWPDGPASTWPRAADLDRVTGDRPTALARVDGHALWVNSAALEAAGIDASTPDPDGGRILRDAEGAPTGVLIDHAMGLVEIPEPEPAAQERWLLAALDAMAATGLTGVHAMGMSDDTLAQYERLDAEGRLPVRVWAYVAPDTRAADRLRVSGPWAGEHLSVVGVKIYADGALGSRGALLSADYADEPGTRGLSLRTTDELATQAAGLIPRGAQLAVHAIGDEAVRQALDAFEQARRAHPDATARLRVEHAQIVRPEDRARFAELATIASVQPTHATSDMPWAEDRLGPERIAWAYTWRDLAEASAPLALGSDFPVENVDPGLGLWSATRRTDLEGQPEGGWYPSQALSEGEAIAGFTRGAAYAVHAEGDLGTLEPGKLADLTLWRVEDGRWRATATIVDGEVVWQR